MRSVRSGPARAENVGLGPGMDMDRLLYNGRTAEYYSEDPYLAGRIAASEIQGIQGQHVIATAKHYVLNDQETHRDSVNVVVSERAAREIYLPPFEASVKQGGAGAIMCSYNRIGGRYACEEPYFLTDILRSDWGFEGFVMTDWGASHSTVASALAGLDQEMPGAGMEGLRHLLRAVPQGGGGEGARSPRPRSTTWSGTSSPRWSGWGCSTGGTLPPPSR